MAPFLIPAIAGGAKLLKSYADYRTRKAQQAKLKEAQNEYLTSLEKQQGGFSEQEKSNRIGAVTSQVRRSTGGIAAQQSAAERQRLLRLDPTGRLASQTTSSELGFLRGLGEATSDATTAVETQSDILARQQADRLSQARLDFGRQRAGAANPEFQLAGDAISALGEFGVSGLENMGNEELLEIKKKLIAADPKDLAEILKSLGGE